MTNENSSLQPTVQGLMAQNNARFAELREKYPQFIYRTFSVYENPQNIEIVYSFEIPGLTSFHPKVTIPKKAFYFVIGRDTQLFNKIAFSIGLAELLSYWKATCSPQIIIEAGKLDDYELDFWKTQYYKGLGQFIFENGIQTTPETFNTITVDPSAQTFDVEDVDLRDENIVPVGGGKDSVVTLELLRDFPTNVPLVIHTTFTWQSALATAAIAGYLRDNVFEISRPIDQNLIELNKTGHLNGHTPVSIVFAFYGALTSALLGKRNIVLSNESSANESSVPGTEINHQYSKTFTVEKDLHDYFKHSFNLGMNYYSLLRPLSEIQIARQFSRYTQYFEKFISCNLGNKTNVWCENCSKCLFSSILMQAFLPEEQLTRIFKTDLLANEGLLPELRGLIDEKYIKPLECVGTKEETAMALSLILHKYESANKPLPYLLKIFATEYTDLVSSTEEVEAYLHTYFDNQNLVPEALISRVKATTV